jgi:putative pyruvate formate lyase activating enzyme
VGLSRLAEVMLGLQGRGCVNINWVTPSHVVPQLVGALRLARRRGLSLPVVYNSSAYDSVDTLRLLAGLVDIYLPDLKWFTESTGARLAAAPDYGAVARSALREMHAQVGDLEIGGDGVARRGLLVRHLVMPGNLSESEVVLPWIAEQLSPRTYVNVMDQYRPAGRAWELGPLDRRVRHEEVGAALAVARAAGLERIDGVTAGQRHRRR